MAKITKKSIFPIALTLMLFSIPALASLNDVKKFEVEQQKKEAPAPLFERPVMKYDAANGRDPFLSYFSKKSNDPVAPEIIKNDNIPVTLPKMTLQGLILGSALKQAIINNKVFKIGDTMDGVKILDINSNGVTLFYKSKQFTLLPPSSAYSSKKNEGGKNE